MRLGIMQPYFLPYIGYYSLIKHVDHFILLDRVQFIYHGWIERNRILKPSDGWQYISVPLKKHSHTDSIEHITIDNTKQWQDKIIAQLCHYKKAPHYSAVIELLERTFQGDYETITSLNLSLLKETCRYLNINTPISIFSEMNLDILPPTAPDEWALNICLKTPGTTEYWNPIGGVDLFNKEKYIKQYRPLFFRTPPSAVSAAPLKL